MKIKRRYAYTVILLLAILIYCLYACYNKNYTLYFNELMKNLQSTSTSAADGYSNSFRNVQRDLDLLLIKLGAYDEISDNIEMDLDEFKKRNSIISYISIIDKDGLVLFGNKELKISEDRVRELFSTNSFNEIDNTSKIFKTEKNKVNIAQRFNTNSERGNLVAILGINYQAIDKLYGEDSFKIYGGYVFLIDKSGTLLAHPNKELVGMNFFNNRSNMMEKLNMSEDDIDKFTSFLNTTKGDNSKGTIHYNAFSTEKISYYSELESFESYSVCTIDFTEWKKRILYITLTNVLPIILTFTIALFLFIRYIYEIKYTDYFTNVLNHQAFNYFLSNHFKRNNRTLNIFLVKIDIVVNSEDNSPIYNREVFVDLSKYFKTLKEHYNLLFRVSNDHYLFVVKSEDYKLAHFRVLYNLIHEDIKGKQFKKFSIKSKALAAKITDKSFDKNNLIDNLMHHMGSNNIIQPFEIINDYNLIVYEKRKTNKYKSVVEQAILENKIIPFYQPIFNIKENCIEKYEVLMRIKQNDEYISPKPFIETAEKEGLISKIDEIIIKKAFLYAYKVKHISNIDIKLTINLSVSEINGTFIRKILEYRDKYGINPKNITFEITETSAYGDIEIFAEHLSKLKKEGFSIAIDDFGTGYSNINQLDCLNIDILKIDGRYIKNLSNSEKDRKILKAFIDIANIYNAKIVAEFVEDHKSYNVLKEFGVDYAQGYYIGRPEKDIPDFQMLSDALDIYS